MVKKQPTNIEASSFRDPNGFIFSFAGNLYRQINKTGQKDFDFLISSGLYRRLVKEELLIPHQEAEKKLAKSKQAHKVIRPKLIPFISYPYEWCFSQLKDAALLTLKIQETALEYEMSLKDASAYNIQFVGYQPILIDTLSLEKYREGKPWIAYRQFCQHFLAPLVLMAKKDFRLNLLSRNFIDGIPLDLTSKLLPGSTKLNFSWLCHIHLHAFNQKRMANKKVNQEKLKMSKGQMINLINNLRSTIEKLRLGNRDSQWRDYYSFTNYSKKAFKQKKALLTRFLKKVKPQSVLDLGANTGQFSQIGCKGGAYTIAADIDPLAVEKAYLQAREEKNRLLLPLIIDLTNPSPDLGWDNKERRSFGQRMKTDCLIALALIHHLAISNNLPFPLIADYFSSLAPWLIIEFVAKKDSKVQILLQNREDVFDQYKEKDFETAFSRHYKIITQEKISKSERKIYLMRRK